MTTQLGAPMQDRRIGTVLDGKFNIHSKIGEGGLKVVSSDFSSKHGKDMDEAAVWGREARTAAQVSHVNCVRVVDYGQTEDGEVYLVMEYLDGKDLEELVGTFTYGEMIDLFVGVCDGLDAIHAKDIVHRDMKLSNVMMVTDHRGVCTPKILDFGLDKFLDPDKRDERDHQTMMGKVSGTPEYMSPEQGYGKDVNHRSDLWSVGILLYCMLTDEVPFTGDSALAVMMKVIGEPARSPREFDSSIPPLLESVVLKLIAKKPAQRYQSAVELKQELLAIRDEIDCDAKPNGLAQMSETGQLAAVSDSKPSSKPANITVDWEAAGVVEPQSRREAVTAQVASVPGSSVKSSVQQTVMVSALGSDEISDPSLSALGIGWTFWPVFSVAAFVVAAVVVVTMYYGTAGDDDPKVEALAEIADAESVQEQKPTLPTLEASVIQVDHHPGSPGPSVAVPALFRREMREADTSALRRSRRSVALSRVAVVSSLDKKPTRAPGISAATWEKRAQNAKRHGYHSQVVAAYRNAYQVKSRAKYLKGIGQAYARQGDMKRACSYFQKYVNRLKRRGQDAAQQAIKRFAHYGCSLAL